MATQPKKILLVDDDEKLLSTIAHRLLLLGFSAVKATSGMAALEIAKKEPLDLAIVDLKMPGMDGLVTIAKLKEIDPDLRTVLLTGHGGDKVRQATESLDAQYFQKDQMGTFWRYIRSLETDGRVIVIRPPDGSREAADQTTAYAAAAGGESSRPSLETPRYGSPRFEQGAVLRPKRERPRIIGETRAMRALRKNIDRVAVLDCPVLLHGENGSGKELAARVIHAASLRGNQRFMAIDCGCFDNDQLRAQVLEGPGGNLSGALQDPNGIFGAQRGGTVLFDQIEALPTQLQVQLLEFMDKNDAARGPYGTEAAAGFRILAATEVDLAGRVETGNFLAGLYGRLKVFELKLPPLRERKDDIAPLASYFLEKYRVEFGKKAVSMAPEVLESLAAFDFPGNVRELEHVIERAVILVEGATIERKHLPARLQALPPVFAMPGNGRFGTLAEMEVQYILEVLRATNGNKSKSAEILGISRAALWRKLKQLKTAAQP